MYLKYTKTLGSQIFSTCYSYTDHLMMHPLSSRYCHPSFQDKQYLVETLKYFAKIVNKSDRLDLVVNLDPT